MTQCQICTYFIKSVRILPTTCQNSSHILLKYNFGCYSCAEPNQIKYRMSDLYCQNMSTLYIRNFNAKLLTS
jgi:hypothetical protein